MLTVMTININYYGDRYGPWSIRKELVRETIQKASPDIIALQAVRQDPILNLGEDQASQLAGLLPGYSNILFQPAKNYPDGSSDGSAILSRIPWSEIHSRELTQYPYLEDENQRIILAASFDLPGGRFHLFNAHFSWVDQQARSNANEALLFVNSFTGPRMLVGDLNQTPGSDALQTFSGAGWTDVWGVLRPDDQGETFIENDLLSKRIDYVWVSPELKEQVQEIEIVGTQLHESGARISDHLGLFVTLS